MKTRLTVLQGDWIDKLRTLPNCSVHSCVTSPPYWGLRDYGVEGQLGLEKTPEEYVAKLIEGFREVRRVLRDDGTLWLNLGDSYASYRDSKATPDSTRNGDTGTLVPKGMAKNRMASTFTGTGIKDKDLVGIPWMVAFALRADGWYLRSDIIWHKPNPMPESVTDRPTKSHEYIFLLSKNAKYYYDSEAIKEACTCEKLPGQEMTDTRETYGPQNGGNSGLRDFRRKYHTDDRPTLRNKRSVWTVVSQPYPESHFATFPEDLIKPCILAGTSAKGCCSQCGAPWERITSKDYKVHEKWFGEKQGVRHNRGSAGNAYKELIDIQTIGWQPTCECQQSQVISCTVLDPFAGSGTTGQVAIELGRKAILIELNPKYVELINQRTDVTFGLALA